MQSELQLFIVNLLREKLPSFYYYHSIAHTLYVEQKVIEIGAAESCSEKEIHLLRAAALWHDTGYTCSQFRHEEESCKLARRYLPDYGYDPSEINLIAGMIMATRMPQSPRNKQEEVIADADLEYLGTDLAAEQADNLFKELQQQNPSLTRAQWQKTQIAFLNNHCYFTEYCKKVVEPHKQVYLQSLLKAAK